MNGIIGKVHSLETFGLVDGPGVRCVIFLKGCHMRCQYCHNPDTWSMEGGEEWTPERMYKRVMRFKPYWKDNGGVTVSGGEALLQIDFIIELFKLLKADGINTAVDTSGNPFKLDPDYLEKFNELMSLTDLFILDIKEMNEEKHKKLTGWTNKNILDLATYLSDHGKDMWIRHVLVPGLTDDEEELVKLKDFIDTLKTVTRVEILPYHTLGLFKWENLGIEYPLDGVPTPTAEEIKRAEDLLGIVKNEG